MNKESYVNYALFNKDACILFCCALLLSFFFLWIDYRTLYLEGGLHVHGEIGYNVYKHNSLKTNKERFSQLIQKQSEKREEKGLIDYADLEKPESFGESQDYRDTQDTVGYGLTIGLLWKLTKSLRYLDIRLLQIFIFSFQQ